MKKKLLIITNPLSFFISHRLEIADAAMKNGYDVKVGYGELGNSNTETLEFLSKKGINCFHLPLERGSINPFKELRSLYSIWQILRQLKPDIVHLITIKAYLYGGIASHFTKVACIVSAITGLGILFNKKRWWNYFLQKLFYIMFYLAFTHSNQRVIVQNSDDRKTLVNWGILDKKKILLFNGSGVDLSKFINLKEKNDILTICFASRFLHDKGVFDFVSAAKIIRNRGIQANFILAGKIDPGNPTSLNEKELKSIIDENIVEVLDFQNDIPSLYEKSHIVCLPSYYGEGLPKALIEAAAASRAIVTTNVPGCRDAIIPNITGLLVPPKNPEKLADALQWLMSHPKERRSMGKAGRNLAEKKFSIEQIIQKHLNIYQELLDERT
tara:strand:- start:7398 stop:8549 length:1152 start_codon:yes stop_codon:yes gene_type:complete